MYESGRFCGVIYLTKNHKHIQNCTALIPNGPEVRTPEKMTHGSYLEGRKEGSPYSRSAARAASALEGGEASAIGEVGIHGVPEVLILRDIHPIVSGVICARSRREIFIEGVCPSSPWTASGSVANC